MSPSAATRRYATIALVIAVLLLLTAAQALAVRTLAPLWARAVDANSAVSFWHLNWETGRGNLPPGFLNYLNVASLICLLGGIVGATVLHAAVRYQRDPDTALRYLVTALTSVVAWLLIMGVGYSVAWVRLVWGFGNAPRAMSLMMSIGGVLIMLIFTGVGTTLLIMLIRAVQRLASS